MTPNFQVVPVLDVPIYVGNIPTVSRDLTTLLTDPASPRDNRCISATSAHGIVTSADEPDFKAILQSFFLNLPDGKPLVWVGQAKGAANMERCTGPDFFAQWMRDTVGTSIRHYFAGGQPGVAEELKAACARQFGNHNIVGTYTPPFRPLTEAEWQALAADIAATRADVVWIGLSTPKQERFARQLAAYVQVHAIVTVGAAFDYHTGRLQRAPEWMKNAGLEWLYRLTLEPKRLYKRYAYVVPRFMWLNLRDLRNR